MNAVLCEAASRKPTPGAGGPGRWIVSSGSAYFFFIRSLTGSFTFSILSISASLRPSANVVMYSTFGGAGGMRQRSLPNCQKIAAGTAAAEASKGTGPELDAPPPAAKRKSTARAARPKGEA